MSGPGVLLDRDRTIIADDRYVGSVDRVEFLDGAIEAIASLNQAKIPIAVVTNQAGVVSALGRTRELPRPPVRPRRFPDAGLVILRSRPGDGPEIWCRCDGGPHGFLSIAAHAHADALSVELRHDGVDVLTDPGTYCHHGEPRWRDWFRSTAAHNTVEVNGVRQAESGGPFLWITQPRTRTITCDVGEESVQTWWAEHDGYLRLDTATAHRRAVTLDSPGRVLTVVDTFDTPGEVRCSCRGTWARRSTSICPEHGRNSRGRSVRIVDTGRSSYLTVSPGRRTPHRSTRPGAGTLPGSAVACRRRQWSGWVRARLRPASSRC